MDPLCIYANSFTTCSGDVIDAMQGLGVERGVLFCSFFFASNQACDLGFNCSSTCIYMCMCNGELE